MILRIRRRALRTVAPLVITVLIAGVGCGTRVGSEAPSPIGAPSPTISTGPASAGSEPAVAAGGNAPAPESARTATAPVPAPQAGRPTGSATAATVAPRGAPQAGSSAPDSSGVRAAPVPRDPNPVPPGVGGPAPAANSPVEIGNVGLYTGPAGALLLPMVQAVQAWATEINSRGGVNGHPVRLTVYDDGGDPARHRSAVQEAVERRKVVAFVGNVEAVAGAASRQYIAAKRVPVIGSEGAAQWFHEDPMYFPQQPSGDHLIDAGIYNIASAMHETKKRKLGVLVCVEIGQCRYAAERFRKLAGKADVDLVYDGRASLAQPDFTAECFAARNAGAEAMLVLMDPASASRIAGACLRQSFRPLYGLTSTAADRMKDDPNLDGLVVSSGVFPYFQADTPAVVEYQRVMTSRAPSSERGIPSAMGWAAAKLFEKAASGLPEPPTTGDVLKGLWRIRDETLGGLSSQPLTFAQDQPASGVTCWFELRIKAKGWVTGRSGQAACAS